jgi:outer membrane protein TolC
MGLKSLSIFKFLGTILTSFFLLLTPASSRSETLTLSACVSLAQKHAPEVRRALLDAQAARGASRQASGQRLPQLFLSGNLDKSDDSSRNNFDSNQALARVEQDLNPLSPAWLTARQRRLEADSKALSLSDTAQQAASEASRVYFSILEAQDVLGRLVGVEKQLDLLQARVLPRFNMGGTPSFDLVKVDAMRADLARDENASRLELAAQRNRLALLCGFESGGLPELQAIASAPSLPENVPDFQGTAGLKALSAGVAAAKTGLHAAWAGYLPTLQGAAEYGYSGQEFDGMDLGWDLLLGVKVPLFDGGQALGQARQARSLLSAAKEEENLELRRRQEDWKQTLAEAKAHRQDAERLTRLLPRAEKAAAAMVERYGRGAASIVDTGEAVQLWLETLKNERDAYYGSLSDLAGLEALSGGQWKADFGSER